LPQLSIRNFNIDYDMVPNEIPKIKTVIYKGENLASLIQTRIYSTIYGTKQYQPFKEFIQIDPEFEKLGFEIFREINGVQQIKPEMAIALADFFFNQICIFYWSLIRNGSKNLAQIFLEKICLLVDGWEKQTKIHKGTLYYFLTFVYRELGNTDAAISSAFKAIEEDKRNLDPLFGVGTYKKSPAYKYVSLKDDKNNYLFDTICELRKFLNDYAIKFDKIESFSLQDLDKKIFQSSNNELEQIGHFLMYNVELISKYEKQMSTLPHNDFYRMKNIRDIFNLCLITDKILQIKYETVFKQYGNTRKMYIKDGVVLLFEDKKWINSLSNSEKKDPRSVLNKIQPEIPDKLVDLITQFFTAPIKFTCCGKNLNYQMRFMLFASALRNMGAHEIGKDDTYVEKYALVIKWLFYSIFVALKALP